MKEFKETNLIVMQGKKTMQIDTLEELIEQVFADGYKDLNEKEKLQQRYNNAVLQSIFNNMDIVYSPKGIIKKDKTYDKEKQYEIKKSFIIDDEITYLLSLCKINDLKILEKENSRIFLSDEDMKDLEGEEGNYIFINKIVDKIMKRHLTKRKEKNISEIEEPERE